MRVYCLNQEELSRFIEVELKGGAIYDDETEFQYLLDNWRYWDTEFICLATTFSQILEQKLKAGQDARSILRETYALSENTGRWLTIEGFDEDFVGYFLRHSRQAELTIEDDLNYLRSQLGEYKY